MSDKKIVNNSAKVKIGNMHAKDGISGVFASNGKKGFSGVSGANSPKPKTKDTSKNNSKK